jgi:hypothetical protein
MKSYKVEQVSSKTMTSKKTGKDFISVGLKIDGEWYNGFGKEGVTDKWEEGMELTGIELYENGDYKNWRFVSIYDRMDALEKRVDELEKGNLGF